MNFSRLYHLRTADGWLDLGNWQAANDELEEIMPEMRAHPFVLRLRVGVYLEARHWEHALAVTEIYRDAGQNGTGRTAGLDSPLLRAA